MRWYTARRACRSFGTASAFIALLYFIHINVYFMSKPSLVVDKVELVMAPPGVDVGVVVLPEEARTRHSKITLKDEPAKQTVRNQLKTARESRGNTEQSEKATKDAITFKHILRHRSFIRPSVDVNNASTIKSAMMDINVEQRIHNLDRFTFNSGPDGVVILVQTHNRPEYLKYLIQSLKAAAHIASSLLIISHDYYSAELNAIIDSVDFCPIMQIFYPYSMQIYKDAFPGPSSKDCPRDIGRIKAKQLGCLNADHPDRYGHYREAKYTQTKHHWFWKSHRVFDELRVTRDFQGLVLLLEEDHFVAPDFIHVLRLMQNHKNKTCKECNILTLGNYDKVPVFQTASGLVHTNPWISSKFNLGMAFNREIWNRIKACSEKFCHFDDYNWDWTLQYLSAVCIPGRLTALIMRSPRVFHIGECGVHHKGKNCNPLTRAKEINKLLAMNRKHLYPTALQTIQHRKFVQRTPKPNGGWGDIRDHELCASFTKDEKQR